MKTEFILEMSDCIDENTPLVYNYYLYSNKEILEKEILEGQPLKYSNFLSSGVNPLETYLPLFSSTFSSNIVLMGVSID
jgi:hypothetical protein